MFSWQITCAWRWAEELLRTLCSATWRKAHTTTWRKSPTRPTLRWFRYCAYALRAHALLVRKAPEGHVAPKFSVVKSNSVVVSFQRQRVHCKSHCFVWSFRNMLHLADVCSAPTPKLKQAVARRWIRAIRLHVFPNVVMLFFNWILRWWLQGITFSSN